MKIVWNQVIIALLIGCLLGSVAGTKGQKWSFHRFWQHGPDTQKLFQKLSRELSLDDKQQETMKALIDVHHQKVMALHQETLAKLQEIRIAMRSDIEKILTPDQQAKFTAMEAKWDASHKLLSDQEPSTPALGK